MDKEIEKQLKNVKLTLLGFEVGHMDLDKVESAKTITKQTLKQLLDTLEGLAQ